MRIWEYIKDKAGYSDRLSVIYSDHVNCFSCDADTRGADGDLSCADSFASGNCHINRLYKTQTFL